MDDREKVYSNIGSKNSIRNVFHIVGAFIAWVIGSGFATGQEVLRFFASYGYYSYVVTAINLVGFIVIGYILLKTGYEHKSEENFNHFSLFCGKEIGFFYTWLITGTLLVLIPVLISGAGMEMWLK